MHGATGEFDAVYTQRKRLGVRIGGGRFAGRYLEQPQQVEFAVPAEEDFGLGLVQFDIRQMQRLGPQAIELQVGIQAFEADLFLAGLTDAQAPKRHFEAERVEFDPLKRGGRRGIVGQLLVGDTQGDARQNQKAQQAVEGQSSQQGADGANQSFVHAWLHLSESECLGVWHAIPVPKQTACSGFFRFV
ncbi:hypothetical protein D3C87_1313370 [compost metagenome]